MHTQSQTLLSSASKRCCMHKLARPVLRHAGRKRNVVARAFRNSEHVSLPMNYYSILRISHSATRDMVSKSFDGLVLSAPAKYSADTLFSRAIFLKSAFECLSSEDSRRSYDLKLKNGTPDLRVSQPDLPGALVLLQEVGKPQDVIDLSIAWLTHNASSPDACDVATCAAMAFFDRATATLQASSVSYPDTVDEMGVATIATISPAAILPACQDLEHALGLMGQHPASSQQLREEIEDALQDMAAQHAVQLLALPLSAATAVHRQKGLRLLRSELQRLTQEQQEGTRPDGGPTCNVQADDLIDQARDWLTAEEQVSLLQQFQSSPATQVNVLYNTALALISVGHVRRWPHLVHQADTMLQEVERVTAASGDPSTVNPVAVERCACAVLLGDSHAALQLLGMGEESNYPLDVEAAAFVQEHGLQTMSQQWLRTSCLNMFREGAAAEETSLNEWFSCPRVKAYLQVRAVTQAGPLLQAAHFFSNSTELILIWLAPLIAALTQWAHATKTSLSAFFDTEKALEASAPATSSSSSSQSESASTSSSSRSSNNEGNVQRRQQQNGSQPGGGRIHAADPSMGERPHVKQRAVMESKDDGMQQTRAALMADRLSSEPGFIDEQLEFEEDEEEYDDQCVEDLRGSEGQSAAAMRSQLQGLELAMWDTPQGFASAGKAKIAVKLVAVGAMLAVAILVGMRLVSSWGSPPQATAPQQPATAEVLTHGPGIPLQA